MADGEILSGHLDDAMLAKFNLIDRAEAYRRFTIAWHEFLGIGDSDELADAGSMLRYLVECAICYDDHTAFSPVEIRPGVVLHWVEPNGVEDQDLEADAEAGAIVSAIRRLLVRTPVPAAGDPT
jgi:hypothetical protein